MGSKGFRKGVVGVASGGARARSGPSPDPNSYRSLNRDWVDLPSGGFAGVVPAWPLETITKTEVELWAALWAKPQAAAWAALDLKYQVAAYVRAFLESVEPGAVNGLKTGVLRMEAELGISIPGMHKNLWRLSKDADGAVAASPASSAPAARKTSGTNWLSAVSVEGA